MNRIPRLVCVVLAALFALTAATWAEPGDPPDRAVRSKPTKPQAFQPDGVPLRAKPSLSRCTVCGRGTCATVMVATCDVPTAMAKLEKKHRRANAGVAAPGDTSPVAPAPAGRSYGELKDAGSPSRLPPKHQQWTDHNTHDPGITLLQLFQLNPSEIKVTQDVDATGTGD